MYVVVSGAPGSGKTTIARGLARELALAFLSKDTVKEALVDALGVRDVEESRRLGLAAITALLAIATDVGSGVLDSVWRPEPARRDLGALPGQVVEVFCDCPPAVARQRHAGRAGQRHSGHFDRDRLAGDDLWAPGATGPVAGPWPVVRVDTTRPVDMARLAAEVRSSRPGSR